jgi:predicted MPP superfamily phosphohydrolase
MQASLIPFLTAYFALGLVLALYLLRWVRPALGWRWRASLWFLLLALLLTLLPVASRLCDRWGHYHLALVTAIPGYVWMAVVLWGVCFGFLAEIANAVIRLASLAAPSARRLILSPRQVVCAVGTLSVLLAVWGAVEVKTLETVTVRIRTPRLRAGAMPIRIVQISDIHLSPLVRRTTLERLIASIANADPDLLLCTGDVFDSTAPEMDDYSKALAQISAPMGKFACLGNHEFYLGVGKSLYLLDLAGFKVLRQDRAAVERAGTKVEIMGVDDPAGRYTGEKAMTDEDGIPRGGQSEVFSILLKHQPRIFDGAVRPPDLQLSGHTHGGQILPAQIFARLAYPRWRGLYELGDGRRLYVNRGVGTWGPPIRVMARPEITLFIIEPE